MANQLDPNPGMDIEDLTEPLSEEEQESIRQSLEFEFGEED